MSKNIKKVSKKKKKKLDVIRAGNCGVRGGGQTLKLPPGEHHPPPPRLGVLHSSTEIKNI